MRVDGVDARTFLQGQLSSDLRALTPDVSLFASYNTPQGRVIALPRLIQRDEQVLAILPRELLGNVVERLRRYVLRSKVVLRDASNELFVAAALDFDASSASGDIPCALLPGAYAHDASLGSLRLAGRTARHLLIGPIEDWVRVRQRLPGELSNEAWRAAAIAAGEPQIYLPTSELFVAQMLNLDLLDALSFTKGCYTGQEIIARTQHLGRIKRRMLRFRLPSGVEARRGDSVTVGPGRSGRVVESARNEAGECEVLAVVPVAAEVATEPVSLAAGVIALPLPYAIPGVD
jgi:hypothetical protein